MTVYFDNAATTAMDPLVLEEMLPYLRDHYGNPSSIHAIGRKSKAAIEQSRKKVAELLNTSPSEIFFTSGGTEADNTAIRSSIETLSIKHVISSPIEHHAVLHTIEHLEKRGQVQTHLLSVDSKGDIDYNELEALLSKYPKSLVSLMHGNNEIGNLLDLQAIGERCRESGSIFHSDTVQTIGNYPYNLQDLSVDFIVGSAHKFHGPKGVGFLYINHEQKIPPFIHGGSQERNMRGGTEHVAGIVGLAKALELSYLRMDETEKATKKLKDYFVSQLREKVPGVAFNGLSADPENSMSKVLSVSMPPGDYNEMLLFNLDINGICASGGSACSSGSDVGSHVLRAINADETRGAVRFSFCHSNTIEEVDYVVSKVAEITQVGV